MANKPKQRRWQCPLCEGTVLGLTKPRSDDARLYCLPCTQKTGRLVKRTCASVERERAQRKERALGRLRRKRARAREKVDKSAAPPVKEEEKGPVTASDLDTNGRRVVVEGHDMHELTARLTRLEAWSGYFDGRPPKLNARQGSGRSSTGSAWKTKHKISITFAGQEHATIHECAVAIIHELAHLVAENSTFNGRRSSHGRRWKMLYAAAFEEVFQLKSAMLLAYGNGTVCDREAVDIETAKQQGGLAVSL